MGDAFYALDGAWRVVYANQRALRFWNLPAERVVGQIIWESLPQLIGTMNEAVLRQVKVEQRTISFEAPSPVTGAWVQVTVGPWSDGVTVYWRDITERRRAAEALGAHEEHLRLAQEAGGTGTWEWDLTADSMIWSAQLFRTLGLEPEPGSESLARLLDLVNPPDRDWMAAQLAGFRITPGRMRIEAPMRRPDGEIRWIVFVGQVEADETGKPVRMLGVTIDGTVRRQTEQAFRADAERLRLAMRAGGLAAWEYDLKTNVRSWSPEAAAMIGRPSNEMRLRGWEWARMIHPEDAPRVWEQFSAAIAGKGDVPLRVSRDPPGWRRALDRGARCRPAGCDGDPQPRYRGGAGHYRAQARRGAIAPSERGIGGTRSSGSRRPRSGASPRGARRADAGAGPARRRHRARLQQCASGRGWGRPSDRPPAWRCRSGSTVFPHHPGCGESRLIHYAAAPRFRPSR